MAVFNESEHPRLLGAFTNKHQSIPEGGLAAENKPRPAVTGERVMVLDCPGWVTHVDNGTFTVTYPNGDMSLETEDTAVLFEMSDQDLARQDRARIAIGNLADQARLLPPHKAEDVAWTFDQINDGAWGDLRTVGNGALQDFESSGIADLWLTEAADNAAPGDLSEGTSDDSYYAMVGASRDAARAVANRHLIGQLDGWTQEAYDHLTRPWRENVSSVHPDDEISPASWWRRPAPSAMAKRKFDGDTAAFDRVIRDHEALDVHRDDEHAWTTVNPDKLGPELTAKYNKLLEHGRKHGLLD